MKRFLLPLALFAIIVGFLAVGLTLNPREVPSPLIGKAAPEFSLPQLHDPEKVFSPKDLAGRVWLLNFWASWCNGVRPSRLDAGLAKAGDVLSMVDYRIARRRCAGGRGEILSAVAVYDSA